MIGDAPVQSAVFGDAIFPLQIRKVVEINCMTSARVTSPSTCILINHLVHEFELWVIRDFIIVYSVELTRSPLLMPMRPEIQLFHILTKCPS